MIFPRMSSQGRIGVTISCSIVPRSRSRTIAVAVSIEGRSCRIIPLRAGTMKNALPSPGAGPSALGQPAGSALRVHIESEAEVVRRPVGVEKASRGGTPILVEDRQGNVSDVRRGGVPQKKDL